MSILSTPLQGVLSSPLSSPLFSGSMWWLAFDQNASFAYDLSSGRYMRSGGASTQALSLTETRASSALVLQSNGTYVERAAGELAIGQGVGGQFSQAVMNYVSAPDMTGAVAGVPGTMPTGWTAIGLSSGVQREVVGVGERDGLPTLKLRFHGEWDAGHPGYTNIALCATGAMPVTEDDQLTQGLHMALIAGSLSPVTNINLNSYYRLAGAYKGQYSTAILPTLDAVFKPFTGIATTLSPTGGVCDGVDMQLYFTVPAETAFDFTLEIGAPFLSPIDFAPPVNIGSGTTTTRAADNPIVVQGAGSVPWPGYDLASGVTLQQAFEPADIAGVVAFTISDGTGDNYLTVRRAAAGGVELEAHSGGVELFSDESATDFPTSLATLELYMKQGTTVTVSLDGTLLSDITQTGETLPDFTKLSVACLNGTTTIKEVYGK